MDFDAPAGPAEGVGRVLLEEPRCEESTDAGSFYCGHAFWTLQHLGVPPDDEGRPRVGFVHLPDDRLSRGGDRFAGVRVVLGRALRAARRQLEEAGLPARVFLFGFGSFADVDDNPSGALVSSEGEMARLGEAAFERGPAAVERRGDLVVHRFGEAELWTAVYPVSDLFLGGDGLRRGVARAAPSAAIGLGIARRRKALSVEVIPTDGGLSEDGKAHEGERPARRRGPVNRWLADAIVAG